MKITDVRVFELVGAERSGLALYEIAREGFAPGQASPHRHIFTEIRIDEGITGLSYGGNADVKAAGRLLIGEDPMRVEYLWDKLFYSSCNRQRVPTVAVLNLALASTYGIPVVPHANQSCRHAIHLLFASAEHICPLGEWGCSYQPQRTVFLYRRL